MYNLWIILNFWLNKCLSSNNPYPNPHTFMVSCVKKEKKNDWVTTERITRRSTLWISSVIKYLSIFYLPGHGTKRVKFISHTNHSTLYLPVENWNEINFRRKMYSYDDDMEILNYIIKNDCHGKVSGITLWEEMEELGVRKEG